MNCDECRDELAAYLEGLLDEASQGRLRLHLAACPACAAELAEVRELAAHLACDGLGAPPVSLEAGVMDRILREQALQLRRLQMRRRFRVWGISGALVAAAAMLLIGVLWVAPPASAENATEILALGAASVPKNATVHVVAKMRTLPADNFSSINPDLDFVKIDVWKQLGKPGKWRVEKPGRVAWMDGKSTALFARPDYATRFPQPSRSAFDTGLLLELASVNQMITNELQFALIGGHAEIKINHETTAKGDKKLLVTVESKSGLPAGDYLKNAFLNTSDMRRTYRFDAKTGRLEGMDGYLHRDGGDVLILKVERIEYLEQVDPDLFAVKLPKGVQWSTEPVPVADNEKYEKMTPSDAARALFEACNKKDWDEVEKFWYGSLSERTKERLGGLQIVHLGEPFQSAISLLNGDWFVPYEIKLKDGTVIKHNLALRKNQSAKRFIVDGGL